VSVVVVCVVKHQQVGPFVKVKASVKSLSQFFFSLVARITSMDSSRMKDMDSPVISGGQIAAEANSDIGGDAVLEVLRVPTPPLALGAVHKKTNFSKS